MNECSQATGAVAPKLCFGVVTLFPQMFSALTEQGVIAKGIGKGLLDFSFWNPRDYTHDRHATVDDRPYGGGPGMLMKVEPLRAAIQAGRQAMGRDVRVIYLSPQGRRLDQAGVEELAGRNRLLLVAGRYEGIDERLLASEIDEEWSIGDYVLSGGELPAMVLMDAVSRLVPGVLGHEASAREDSFVDGLLDCPHYTRPEVIDGQAVPDVLLSGNHEAIRRWRLQQSLGRTWLRRPDLLQKLQLNQEQQNLLAAFIREHDAMSKPDGY